MSKIDLSAALVVFNELYEARSISSTADNLNISRSTVRSHIDRLAKMLNNGEALTDRGKLTEGGERLYARVRYDLAAFENSLEVIKNTPAVTGPLAWASQRHQVSLLDDKALSVPIIRHAWQAWRSGSASLDSLGMRALVPWTLIFRPWTGGWMLVEIGERSSYVSWFGAERARYFKSEIRQPDLTGGVSYEETSRTYDEVARWGTPILHHIHACIPRVEGQDNEWVSYQRLVLPINWGEEAGLAVFSARTNKISIDSLAEQDRHLLPDELLMEEEPTGLGTL